MRAIKFAFWGLVALVLLAALGLGLFISTFDANRYRDLLGDYVERATGRRLTINGELSLAVWPQIALRAEGLSLANPTDFDPEPSPHMLQAAALEATIALQPLLQRQLQIDGIVLYSPQLRLVQQANEANNWSDLEQRFGNADNEAPDQLAVALNSVTLKDATISLREPDGSLLRLSALNLQANFTDANALALVADGAWQSEADATAATFTLDTELAIAQTQTLLSNVELSLTLPMPDSATLETVALTIPSLTLDADLEQASIPQGSAQLANSTVNFEARLSNLLTAGQLDGNLSMEDGDTNAWLKLGGIELPASLRPNQLETLDLAAKLTANLSGDASGNVQVHHYSVSLGGTRQETLSLQADGALQLNPAGHATGSLTLAPTDLRALGRALPKLIEPGLFIQATSPQPSPTPTTPLGPTLQTLQADFKWVPATATAPATLNFSNSRLAALGIVATLQGETRLTDPTSTTSAIINLATFSPKQALTYFAEPILTTDPNALSSASGSLVLLQDATGNHLNDLDISLDKSQLSGTISLLEGPVPTLRFDTRLNTLDMTGYLAPDAKPTDTGQSLESADLLGDLVLPTELLRAYDLTGSMRVDRLQLYDLLLNSVGGRIRLGDGAAAISGLSARLYGGSFIGKIGFKQPTTDSNPELSVTGDLQAVDVQALMQAVSNTHDFTGRGNLTINMTGQGFTALEATQSAAGTFSLALQKGNYTGINMGHELCKLYNGLRNKPAPPSPTTNSTRFDTFSASATVSNGTAETTDLIASNSYLKLSGKGRTQLARQSINYDLDIELTGPIEATNCETLTPYIGSRIPVRLTGTFANPTLRPDFGKLAKREIRRRVEDKLTEKLFDLLGGKKTEPTAETSTEPSPEP